MTSRKEKQREATIKEIKNLAWEQMKKNGPANLSLRRITSDMKMSSAAIFRYFSNRDALLDALTEDAFRSQNNLILETYRQKASASLRERFKELGKAYRNWGVENPVHYMLIYGTPIPGYLPDWHKLIPETGKGLSLLCELVALGYQTQNIKHPTPSLNPQLKEGLLNTISSRNLDFSAEIFYIALAIWSRLHGLTSLELIGQYVMLIPEPELFFTQELDSLLDELLIMED
jgi:AcrR family transcriptional regulator